MQGNERIIYMGECGNMNNMQAFISRYEVSESEAAGIVANDIIESRNAVQLPFNGNDPELKIRRETTPDGSLRYIAWRKYDPATDGTPEDCLEEVIGDYMKHADGDPQHSTLEAWLRSDAFRQTFRKWCSDVWAAKFAIHVEDIKEFACGAAECVRRGYSFEQFMGKLKSSVESAARAGKPLGWKSWDYGFNKRES